jgi:small-conductance mechanosensitive channel
MSFLEQLKTMLEFPIIEFGKFSLTLYNVLFALLALIATRYLVKATRMLVRNTFERKKIDDPGKMYTVSKLTGFIIYMLGILLSLEVLGINISLLWASSAALFVGLGFGLQDIFKDILSGFVLLFEGTIQKGHIVELNNMVGKVEQMDIRTSKVRTRDGIVIIVPNSHFITDDVINWSHNNAVTRFKVSVGVAYGSDTEKVKAVLEKCALSHPQVKNEHGVLVRIVDFDDSSLNFDLLFWVLEAWEIENIKSDIRFAIDKAFRENNIQIPFPQRDVHIIEAKK